MDLVEENLKVIIFITGLIMVPVSCFSHGVMGAYENGGICVIAQYDDGEPFDYAETRVFAPDSEITFSSGVTDRNGRFCFYPDVTGTYQVTVKDGMGHMLKISVPFKGEKPTSADKKEINSVHLKQTARFEKGLLALSIIFFIFGGLFWWKGRK